MFRLDVRKNIFPKRYVGRLWNLPLEVFKTWVDRAPVSSCVALAAVLLSWEVGLGTFKGSLELLLTGLSASEQRGHVLSHSTHVHTGEGGRLLS